MWPLLFLSIVTLACALERTWFWCNLTIRERRLVRKVLAAAEIGLEEAEAIALCAKDLSIGRFLVEPLKLRNPTPETFHLAVKAACDKECLEMRRGNRLLESAIAIAPLLGILGTASGLIAAFKHIKTGSNTTDFSAVTTGLAEALITSTTGIALAIIAFVIFRIFVILQFRQIDFFSKVGYELELIYLQRWNNVQLTIHSEQLTVNSNQSIDEN
ncbi:MotA/TolQ/ExbB proton channel family protein [Tolypothrix bouteillei VB521301]|uniref:Biopolymer transporter ExbB n=3 Tax=Nostocales TaxID=1161 RepID=A0A0C1QUI2_9CYAN|nr:MotA/TolQ/ExbB proton channel family protein [Tolypothrix bouteillei VB521301]